mgnify:CR=1 FL=1
MRAVPALQEVRLASHAAVTAAQARLLAQALPHVKRGELQVLSRFLQASILKDFHNAKLAWSAFTAALAKQGWASAAMAAHTGA